MLTLAGGCWVQGCDASGVIVMGGMDGVVSGQDGFMAELGTPESTKRTGRRRGKNHKQNHIKSVIKHFKARTIMRHGLSLVCFVTPFLACRTHTVLFGGVMVVAGIRNASQRRRNPPGAVNPTPMHCNAL